MFSKVILLALALVLVVNGAVFNVNVGTPSNSFAPADTTVNVGDVVVWTWSASGHDVVSGPCDAPTLAFNSSGLQASGFSFNHTFNTLGVYTFHCTPHCPSMVGTINVTTATPNPTTATTATVATATTTTTTSSASAIAPLALLAVTFIALAF